MEIEAFTKKNVVAKWGNTLESQRPFLKSTFGPQPSCLRRQSTGRAQETGPQTEEVRVRFWLNSA